MPYQYLEDVATADIAFEAWGKAREDLFVSAADAVMNVMVEDLESIAATHKRAISLQEETLEMLLFQFLQELVYYKDAEQLLLRVPKVAIRNQGGFLMLTAEARGELLNPNKHRLNVDVKAVTMHRFKVAEGTEGWKATVVLDI